MNRRSFCEGLIAAILTVVWPINRTTRQAAAFVSAANGEDAVGDIAYVRHVATGRYYGPIDIPHDEPFFTSLKRIQQFVQQHGAANGDYSVAFVPRPKLPPLPFAYEPFVAELRAAGVFWERTT